MFETEDLPDGSTLRRRFEDGRLVGSTRERIHPSGRRTTIRFDTVGAKVAESHSVGLDIILTMTFENGVKTSETYVCKRRLVGRKTYEKRRADYPDMPSADAGLQDLNAELLALERERRKAASLTSAMQKVDPERGRKLDDFCRKMMEGDGVEEALSWIDRAPNTLGEMSRAASRKLIAQLKDLGCPSLFVCKVSSVGGNCQNTSHLVIELPNAAEQRATVCAALARIAKRQGYDPYPDDGQRYQYAKLD